MNSADAEKNLESQLGATLENVAGLIQVMHAALHGSGRNPDHPAFVALAAKDGSVWSLLDAIRASVSDESTRLAAYRYLLPASAHLATISPAQICDLLTFLRKQSAPAWSLPDTLVTMFRRRPTLGAESLNYAISAAQSGQMSLLDVGLLATSVAIADPTAALTLFLPMADATTEPARLAVLRGVSAIGEKDGLSTLMPHRDLLRTLANVAIATESTAIAAWDLLCRISPIDTAAASQIEQATESGPREAQIAISTWLAYLPDERWPNDALLRMIKGLLAASTRNPEIRSHVDHAVGMLLGVKTAAASIVEACDALCERGVEISLNDDFHVTFGTVTSDAQLFSSLLSRWLLKDKIAVVPLRSLLQHGFLVPELVVPDMAAFSAAGAPQRVRAVRRLLGLSLNGSMICTFAFALANSPQLQPWGLETFRDVLQNYVFVEFPHAAREFLDREAKRIPRASPVGKAISGVRRAISKWDKVLRELPDARELRPTEAEKFALRLVWMREQREIHRQAKKQSVFRRLVTEFNAKQGSTVVTRIEGQPPQLIKMQVSSHGFELPSSERSDPLWGHMQRLMYLKETE